MLAIEDKLLRRRIVFLNSIRIAILSVLITVSVIILLFFKAPFAIEPIIISLIVALLVSIFYFPLNRILKFNFLIFIQLILDILVITILVYFSGGIISPFYFLYILPIIVSSFFLTRRDTVYIATFSFIIFGILSDLLYLKIIPFYTGTYENISLGTFIYNLLMGFIAFLSMSVIASYYYERLRKTREELRSVQENLQDLILLNNSVMERMGNGFIISSSQGQAISYNKKAVDLLKINSTSNIFELILSPADLSEIVHISQGDVRYYFEKTVNHFELGISVSMIEKITNFDRVYVFIVTDLSQIKSIEKKLREKEHLALIGEMATGIAHEIRNPLASISGSIQFLEKELKLSPEHHNLMDIVVRESDRLSKSVEEFLNYTRSSPLKKEIFDLSDLVSEIMDILIRKNRKIKFKKKFSAENEVNADIEKIRQVIWNLLNNAVKAIHGTGDVEVAIYRSRDDVYFSVKDSGIGMDSEEIARIFIPFYSNFSSGIGLGMTIVKRILEEHQFEIEIISKKKKGTQVIVCLKDR